MNNPPNKTGITIQRLTEERNALRIKIARLLEVLRMVPIEDGEDGAIDGNHTPECARWSGFNQWVGCVLDNSKECTCYVAVVRAVLNEEKNES